MQTAGSVPHVERQVVLAALLFSAAMIALLAWAAVRLGITVPGCVTSVKPFTQGELIEVAPRRYEAHVVAKMFSFNPSPLKVPRGSVVDFYVTSRDVVHGFYVDGTDVNLMALPDAVTYAQAHFDRPGRYQVICHEFCGLGHQDMAGVIEVTP